MRSLLFTADGERFRCEEAWPLGPGPGQLFSNDQAFLRPLRLPFLAAFLVAFFAFFFRFAICRDYSLGFVPVGRVSAPSPRHHLFHRRVPREPFPLPQTFFADAARRWLGSKVVSMPCARSTRAARRAP